MAFPAIQVWFDRAAISGADVGYAFPDLEHFHTQFVTGNARVVEEGKFSEVTTDVGPAYAHPRRADESFSGSGLGRFGCFKESEGFGRSQLEGFHEVWQEGVVPFLRNLYGIEQKVSH